MNQRPLLPARILTAACLAAMLAVHAAFASEVALEDSTLQVAFDGNSGALTRLEDKTTHWVMERRPELGISFRMFAPLPDRRYNPILGRKQHADRVEKLSDHQVRLQWRNVVSENGGVLPLTFTATVTLTNGALTFDGTLVNDSALTVETIDYPCFGDFNPPTRETRMWTEHMWYGNLGADEIYPSFNNEKGYWGVLYPTKTIDSKQTLFCLIQCPGEGLYVEMADPTQWYLLEWSFEQHPGLVSPISSRVPQRDQISGHAVHLVFRTCHFIFAHPHSTVRLAPVVLRGYRGDWHAGVDLYKQWRATWFKPPQIPGWVKQVHSWTMLRLNTPEQDYAIPYTNLASYAREWAANGVRAVQLVGWNKGGQDGDDPSLSTDPHLGTWEQFHDAIAKMQAMGVQAILFGKLNWADLTTAWYSNELYKYQCTDPYGIPYQQGGYSYDTPTQLAGINNHRRAVMDVLDPEYRDIATREFQKILALGSAGWLWDEVCHHGPVEYSFAPDHGYIPPGYIYAGDLPLARQLRAAADKVSPGFLFAGEGPQDWLMQYYPVSETGVQPVPVCQYIDSRHCFMLAGVSGFDDHQTLNRCLLDRYVIQYEPYYYKGRLTAFPLTLDYGKKIDALRRRYSGYLWDGQFRDTLGANVTADGTHRYSVFVTAQGKRAVVVINEESNKAITARVALPNPGRLIVATPEDPGARPTDGTLAIPARSAAVVMEQ
ncbi:MAG: hypothetical protein KGJ60_03945 [Verrucomicrobiota bacterium]|nr:hypothetical protein [Verrucomicrobiota bacterium]